MIDRLVADVTDFVRTNYYLGSELPLDTGASLVEAGVIDSTGVLELVTFLEERFGIVVDDREITPANLDTIDGIVRLVARKIARDEPLVQTA